MMNEGHANVKILFNNEQELIARFKNVSLSYINTIRKLIFTDVASVAFDYIEITNNTTIMPNEQLQHLIGLLPLQVQNIEQFVFPEDCDCEEFCENCSVTFFYDSNEHQNVNYPFLVTSKHLIQDNNESEAFAQIPSEENGIPIVPINSGQRLSFKAVASLGKGKTHSKFNPASIITYYKEDDVSFLESELEKVEIDILKKLVDSCPIRCKTSQNLIDNFFPDIKSKKVLFDKKYQFAKYCEFCERSARELKIQHTLVVGNRMPEFLFHIESNGSISPIEILKSALELIEGWANEIKNAILELKT